MAHGARLYVGNLAFSTTEDTLRSAFSQDGRTVVEVKIVTDRDTGQPRGFAFVEMTNANEAQNAISQLNAADLHGRTMNVNEARPKPTGAGGGRGGFGGSRKGSGRGRW